MKYGPYSPSRLDTGTCGYAFYHQYIDANKKKSPENLPQARGSAVHEVFEKITKQMVSDPKTVFSEADLKKWVVDAVTAHPAAYEEVGEILEMVKQYLRKPPKVLTEDAGIELKLAIKLKTREDGSIETYQDTKIIEGQTFERPVFIECDYDDPSATARGRADILLISDDATQAVIYDHKTQPNVEEADTFQMGFYAWVISRIYPFLSEIHTILHFARYGIYSSPYIWKPLDLLKIEDEFMTRVSIIESRQSWDPIPHKNCQYCPYIAKCPALEEFMTTDENGNTRVNSNNLMILGDTGKAVKIAGLINILEQIVGTAKDELKEHVKKSGAISIPGKVYEYRTDESINWDKVNKSLREQTYSVFEKYGVDPRLFMSFNQTASKEIWLTENEALVKELSELFPRKGTSRFGGYKA